MADFPQKLISGYKAFREGDFPRQQKHFHNLAVDGQKPETLVFACCDSRAAPETLFNANPGDLFVSRIIANLVPACAADGRACATSSALEYAIHGLDVRNILVLGHAKCGGIAAALDPNFPGLTEENFVGSWISNMAAVADSSRQACSQAPEDAQQHMEQANIRQSLANLRTFPWVLEREKKGKLNLHGAWFDIGKAQLWILNEATATFAKA